MHRKIDDGTILKICQMRLDGYTYEDISVALSLGSRQRTHQILEQRIMKSKMLEREQQIALPNVYRWMRKNGYGITSFACLIGMSAPTVTTLLKGKRKPSLRFAGAVSAATGLTLEQVISPNDESIAMMRGEA